MMIWWRGGKVNEYFPKKRDPGHDEQQFIFNGK